ncbi:MAG: Type 1 glutamine amidotransferase-like domain-containing protein [Betaproteobacteria bacterium]
MQRILAIGGGGFLMEEGPSPIDRYLLSLANSDKPRVCFVPTPSGDLPEHLDKFYEAYPTALCDPSHLSFFRKPSEKSIALEKFEEHVLSQDIVFIGGGNTKSALAVWREWGLDVVLGKALVAGVILSGMSAGAMCWFQQGLTDSFWSPEYRPLKCLGFLVGGCGVHYNGDPKRRHALHAAVQASAIKPSIAIDDYAGVLYCDGQFNKVLSWRDGSTAYRVSMQDGRAIEVPYDSERIAKEKANL